MMIKVLLVDDQSLIRQGLRVLLECQLWMELQLREKFKNVLQKLKF